MSPKQTSKPTRKKGVGNSIGLNKKTSASLPSLQTIVDLLPEAVISTDIQTRITGWNAAAERMYGWKAAEVLGKPTEDFLHTQYQNTNRNEAVAIVIENGRWFNTVTQLCKDGTRIPVISSVSVIKDDAGEPVGYVGINRDYTREARLHEIRREQAEAMLNSVLDAAPDAMVVINKKGEILLADKQVEAVFGYSQSELVGQSLMILIPERFRAQHNKHEQNFFTTPRHRADSTLELFALRKDGTEFPAEININHHMVGGEMVAIASVRDITERKKIQEDLEESERKNRALFNQYHDAVFILDLQGNHLDANQRAADMLGYTREELLRLSIRQLSAEPEQSLNIIERLLKGEHFPVYERLFHRKNGTLLPAEINVELVRDANGSPLHIQSVVRDISERKIAEKKLRESEQRYRNLVENMHEIVMEIDAEGIFCYLSPNYEAFSGYAIREELGTSAFTHVHPEDRYMLRQRLAQISHDKFETFTYRVQIKSGAWVWVETTARPSQAEDGSPRIIGVARDLSNRYETERSLRESQSILATAEEVAGIGSWRWDLTTQKVTWSDEMFRLFGVEREGFDGDVGRVIAERIHPEDATAVNEANRSVLEESNPKPISYHIVLPDGGVRNVWAQGKLIRDEQGNPVALTGFVQDITERVRAEEQIQQMKRLYATLSQVNQTIVRVKEPGELYQPICDMVVKFGEFSLAWVGLLDEETGEIKPVAAHGMDLDNWKLPIINIHSEPFKNHLTTQAIQTGEVTTSEDVQSDPRLGAMQEFVKDRPYHATAVVPFKRGGKVVGVLIIVSPQAGFFKADEELALLAEMGMDISFALDLMENERIKQQWADAFEHSAHGMVIGDPKTNRIRACNPAFAREQGATIEELIGMPLIDMYQPEDHARIKQLIAQSDREGTVQFEALKVRKDGSTYPCQLDLVSVRDEKGELLYRVASQQDITERKQAEEALRISEKRYRTVIENQTEFIVRWKPDGTRIFANEAYLRFFRLSADPMDTSHFMNLVIEEDRSAVQEKLSRLQSGAHSIETDVHRVIKPDGSIAWQEWTDRAIHDQAGQLVEFQSIGRDITERKRTEDALRESESKYRLLAENITDVIWILDIETSLFRYVSPSVEHLRGYTATEMMSQSLNDALTPPSLEYLAQTLPARLDLLGKGVFETYTDELEQPCKDGSTVWTETTMRFVQNPETGHMEVYGVSRNITERKQAETALRISEENYRSLAETSDSAIAVLDREGMILYANPTSTRVWGDPNIIGKTVFDIYPPEYAARYLPFIQKVIDEQVVDLNELETPINGQMMWFRISMSPIKNSDGTVNALLLNAWDITERKQAEAEIEVLSRFPAENPNPVMRCDTDGRLLYANTASAPLLELWNCQVNEYLPDEWKERIADAAATGSQPQTDVPSKEHVFSVRITPIPGKTYINIYAIDITERKRAEEKLAYQAFLLENINDAILATDGQRVITSWNPAAEKMFGWTEEEAIGHLAQEILSSELTPEQRDLAMKQLAETGEYKIETRITRKDGSKIWVDGLNTSLRGSDGEILGYISINRDITERKLAEDKLRESEQTYRGLLNGINDTVWVIGFDTSLLDFNTAAVNVLGYTREELLKMKVSDIDKLATSEEIFRLIESLPEEKQQVFESQHTTKDGRTIPVEISSSLVTYKGQPAIISIARDITERKQAEEKVRESEQRYRGLFEDVPIAIWEQDFSEIKQHLDSLKSRGVSDFHTYFAEHPEELIFCQSLTRITDINQAALLMYEAKDKQELINATLQDTSRGELENGVEEMIAIAEGRTTHSWEGSDETLTGTPIEIHMNWSVVPGHEQNYSKVIVTTMDITERKQAEEALRKSESLLAEAQKIGRIGHWEWTAPGKDLICSDELFQILEIPKNGKVISQLTISEMIAPEDQQNLKELDHAIFARHGDADYEYQVHLRSGRVIWLHQQAKITYAEDGTPIRMMGTIQDVTGRKQAEDGLRRSEHVLRLFVEHSPASIAMFDRDMRYIVHSRRYVLDYQLPDQDLTGRSHYEVFPEIPERWKEIHRRCLAGKIERADEDPFPRLNGHVDYVRWEIHPWYEDNGAVGGVILFSEVVTERVRARKELVEIAQQLGESRSMLELIIESAPIRVFWKDTESRYLGCNRLFAKDTGYDSPDEIIGRLDDELVWKDKAEIFRQQEREIIETGIPKMNKVELQATPDGGTMWVDVSMVPLKDSGGEVIGTLGIYEDITERKHAEEELFEAREIFQKTFTSSPFAISLSRLSDRIIVDVNSAMENLLGWSREELVGKPSTDFDYWADLKERERALETVRHTGSLRDFEFSFKTKAGTTGKALTYTETFDQRGDTYLLSTFVDITERREAEEALKESEARFATAFFTSPVSQSIITQEASEVLAVNDACCTLFGYSREELIGVNTAKLNLWENPTDRLSAVEELQRTGRLLPRETTARKKSGEKCTVIVEIAPITWKGIPCYIATIFDITDRKQAEEALRENEAFISAVLDNLPIGIAVNSVDPVVKFTYMNDYFPKIYRTSREKLSDMDTFWDVVYEDPIFREEIKKRIMDDTASGDLNRNMWVDIPIKRAGEETTYITARNIPFPGKPMFISTVWDVTERKQAETALTHRLAELELLYLSGLALSGELDPRQVARKLIEALEGKLDWHHVAIRKYDSENDRLELLAFNQPSIESEAQRQALEGLFNEMISNSTQGLSGWVVRHGETVRSGDVRMDERYADTHPNIHSGLYVPMMLGERVVGVISVESEELNAFTESDERLLKTIANQAAVAFENARLFQDVQHELAERIQAEKSLRQSEERYRQTLDTMMEGCQIIGFDWQYLYVNDAAAQQGRASREALTGKTMMEVYPGIETTQMFEVLRDCMEHRVMRRMENEFHFADGTKGWFDLNIQPVPEGIFILSFDITERKQAEKAILRYNEQLAEVVEIEYSLAASLNQEQIYETLQRGIHHLLPDIATIFFSSFDAEREVIKAQFGLQDQEKVDVSELPELPYMPDGQETQSRVIQTRQPFIINSNLKNSFRQTVQVGTDKRVTQSALYVPMLVQEQVLGVIQVQSYSPNRFTDEDAKVLLLIANTAAVTIQNARLFETAQKEIIDRTQAENALKTSEERLRLTLQTTSDGFWIVDTYGKFLEVNNAYCEMSGYTREELLQMGIPDVDVQETAQDIKERIEKIQHEDHDRFETRHRRKDGSEFDVEVSVNMLDAEDRVMICFCRDISERKEAEHEIQQRSEDLLLLNTLNDAANRGESFEAITEIFARETRSMFNCQDLAIYLLSPDGQYLDMQSTTISASLTEQIERIIGVKIPRIRIPVRPGSTTEGLIARKEGTLTTDPEEIQKWIMEFTETTFLPSILQTAFKKLIPAIFKLLKINATISVPLVSFGRVIGMLDMSTNGKFTPEDLQRVRVLSHQMTAVILRKQAELNVQTQLKRITGLNEIDRAISASLDMRLSLDVLLNEVTTQLGVDAAAILLLDPIDQALEYTAGKGFRTSSIRESRMQIGQGLAGQAGLERRVVHVPNLAETGPNFLRANLLKGEHFVEYFGVPLIAKGLLKGVLEIFNRTPLTIDPEWMSFLETLGGQAAIAVDNAQLFEGMQRSNQELVTAYDATIAGWSLAMDLRDKETEGHTQRVTELTLKLAKRLGISEQEQVQMRRGALLHDIGKLGVPDQILLKPGKLTDEEWEIMRQHPTYAYEMLLPIKYLRPALDIPYAHHEKWDGSGYPRKLKGEQIPLAARIFAIIDVWDALRSDRPYRPGWSVEKIREHIREQSGKHFDPYVVNAFMRMLDDLPDMMKS